MLIPSGQFDAGAAVGQRGEAALAVAHDEEAVEMWRVSFEVRREFFHGRRVDEDGGSEKARFFDSCDSLNGLAVGALAQSCRADFWLRHGCLLHIRDARAEIPFLGRTTKGQWQP